MDHSHSPRLNFGFRRLRFVKFAPCGHRGVWSFCLMSWFIWRAFFFLIFFFMTESHVHTAFIHLFSTAASIFLCSSCKCLQLFGISAPKNPSPSVVDLQFVHCDCQASLTVWLCSLQPQDLLGSLLVPKHLTVALAFPGFIPKGQWLRMSKLSEPQRVGINAQVCFRWPTSLLLLSDFRTHSCASLNQA